jgi:hypothetical protein
LGGCGKAPLERSSDVPAERRGAGRLPPSPLDPCQLHGTPDFDVDLDGNTVTQLVPASGDWLPDGKDFCAFAFTLAATGRVTDGRSACWQTVFWQDLVGIGL